MCTKRMYMMGIVLLVGMMGTALAVTTNWTGNGANNLWTTSGNWDAGVPGSSDIANVDDPYQPGPVVNSSVTCSAIDSLGNSDKHGICYIDVVSGGSLTVNGDFTMGLNEKRKGALTVSGGSVSCTNLLVGVDGWGRVIITAGTIDVSSTLKVPSGVYKGHIYLRGGTITANSLTRYASAEDTLIDITEGTLILNGNVLSTISSWVSSGYITAYGGPGTVSSDYDVTNAGKTTVTASPPTDPADGGGDTFVTMTNGNVKVKYNLTQGRADFYLSDVKKINHFFSAVDLESYGYVTSKGYTSHSYSTNGTTTTITCSGGGNPTMKQIFKMEGTNYFRVKVKMEGEDLSSNWMAPVVMENEGGVTIGSYDDTRALYHRFGTGWKDRPDAQEMTWTRKSYGCGAFYDNMSRDGLVIGAVKHDVWKSAVEYCADNDKLNTLYAYGGTLMPHMEVMSAHGSITGNTIESPEFFVGFYDDWRDGMEKYADVMASITPKCVPPTASSNQGVPLGWKHAGKGGINSDLTYQIACDMSDYVADYLQNDNFYNEKNTLYCILGAGGMFQIGEEYCDDFVTYVHNNGQKAGFYFKTFCQGGWPDDIVMSDPVEGAPNYTWNDIVLRDGSNDPIVDRGRICLDPTHPGQKQRVEYYIDRWKTWGADYFRQDFIETGLVEADHWYDTNVKTGMQAYNQGMAHLIARVDGTMHTNSGVSANFPYNYLHSKRTNPDARWEMDETERGNNALTSMWWYATNGLSGWMDPGQVDFDYGTWAAHDPNIAKSRVNCGVIHGGIIVNSNDLRNADQKQMCEAYLSDQEVMTLARKGKTFKPVENNCRSFASDAFVLNDSGTYYLAVFNYKDSQNITIPVDLARAGLSGSTSYEITDLWGGGTSYASGTWNVNLDGGESKLVKLEASADQTPPTAPTGLAATAGDTQVNLDWNDNTEGDLDGYNVYRSTTSGSGFSKINSSLVSVSAYTDNTVSNGTTYYYVATAVDTHANESNNSNEDSAIPSAGSSETDYFNPTDDSFVKEALPGTNFSGKIYLRIREDTDVRQQSYLKFTVSDVTGSVLSATLKMYSNTAEQNVPVYEAASNSWTEETITWNNAPGSTGSALDTQYAGLAAWVEWDVTSLITGDGTYSIVLKGTSAVATKDLASKEDTTHKPELAVKYSVGPDTTPPANPTGLAATPDDEEVALDWNDNTEGDLDGYNVYRSLTSGSGYSKINGVLITPSAYTDSTVSNNTTYYFKVTAVDTSTNESGYSNEDSAMPISGGNLQFNPTDDSYVKEKKPTTNYGSEVELRVRGTGSSKEIHSYLKFTVSGVTGTISTALLKIRSKVAIDDTTAKAVSDTSWTEGSIIWNNKPAMGSTLDTQSSIAATTWYSFDVTSHITGNGTFSLGLTSTHDAASLDWSSKESAYDPILDVTW